MKKYNVTLYYHTFCDVQVEAENEEDAIMKANELATELDGEVLDNLEADADPDVELIEED